MNSLIETLNRFGGHFLNFAWPRPWQSSLLILLFSAVALPMGGGLVLAGGGTAADTSPPLRGAVSALPDPPQGTNLPTVIVTAEIYQISTEDLKTLMSGLTFHLSQGNADAWWSASPVAYANLLSRLSKSGFTLLFRPRLQTSSGKEADFFVGNDQHGTELDFVPMVTEGQVSLSIQGKMVDASAGGGVTNGFQVRALMPNHGGMVIRVPKGASNAVVCLKVEILTSPPAASSPSRLVPLTKPRSALGTLNAPVFTGPGRQAIMAKLGTIHFEQVSYDGLPLKEVLKQLSQQCLLCDPEGKGINFLINHNPDHSSPNPNAGLPSTPMGGDEMTGRAAVDVGTFIVNLASLTDVRLADLLDAMVLVTDHPMKYSVQDFGIIFSARNPATSQVSLRTFRVDPNTFYSGLEQVSATSVGAIPNSGSGNGQNQNQGAVIGVVNAFPGAGSLRNPGQSAGGGGQGSGSLVNNPPADGAGVGR